MLPRSTLAVTTSCLLPWPSYAAGADSLFIAGATYYKPGVSGPGWAWADADQLELNGYTSEAIGSYGDLVVTLIGQNTVLETSAPDVDISRCGIEVWGDLMLRGTGSLVAKGLQCGIYVSGTLAVDGCKIDARADGADIADERVASMIADVLAVRGGGRVVAAGAGSGAGVRAYGVRLLDEGSGADVANVTLVVDASWLDATGTDAGVACDRGSLVATHFATPASGTFGVAGVVDADGSVVPHVVIEPDDATVPVGETDSPGGEVPGDGGSTADFDPAISWTASEQATHPTVKPATATKTTITTTVTNTTAAKASNPKSATATFSSLPKTIDSHWIAVSPVLFLLGMALLSAAHRC